MLPVVAAKLLGSVAALRPWAVLSGRPTRAGGLLMYCRGLLAGARTPIDREQRTFRTGPS